MARPKFTSTVPTRCVERHPTKKTVYFAGVPVNLHALAGSYRPPLGVPMLSLVMAGKRNPSLDLARKMADGLGMQLQAFLDHV